MARALYRKYRSKTLDEIVGQGHITDILKRSIAKDNIAHAYLLTGPRGVGKTSIARILAHEINQLPYEEEASHLDIIEIDAASNNGVDDIRDLRDRVQLAPVSADKKIYIIDEVHMLSKSAFNALLKTLEEPPEHVIFILATTNPDKMPDTIISRTQHFAFRAITTRDAVEQLKKIAKSEKIKIDDEALAIIAARGDGSFRDSISLLDQLMSLSDGSQTITRELVEQSLGLAPATLITELLDAYETKNLNTIVSLLNDSESAGVNPIVLSSQLIEQCREQITANPQLAILMDSLLEVPTSSQPNIKLLTVLAAHAVPKTKSVALSSSTRTLSAPIEELERQAKKSKPSISPSRPKHQAATSKKSNFNWDDIVAYTKANSVATYSVLVKCTYEKEGEKLRIYAGNKFYKKKLDDIKYNAVLVKALEETGSHDLVIDIIPTTCPPRDSTAAAVAVIMGGGEEVSL